MFLVQQSLWYNQSMKKFEFEIKGGEKVFVELTKLIDEADCYEICALDANGGFIGYIDFDLYPKQKACFLDAIEVSPIYLNAGVGSCMSVIFEKFLLQNGVETIDGIYCPHGKFGKFLAKKFYLNHSYAIFKNTYIHKNLRKNDYNVPELIEVSRIIDWLPTGWAHTKRDKNLYLPDDLEVDDCKE